MGATDAAYSLAFSPDSQRLASVSDDRTLRIWDLKTGQEIRTLKGHTSEGFSCVAYSPDGKRLAANGPAGTVTIWDATPLPQKP